MPVILPCAGGVTTTNSNVSPSLSAACNAIGVAVFSKMFRPLTAEATGTVVSITLSATTPGVLVFRAVKDHKRECVQTMIITARRVGTRSRLGTGLDRRAHAPCEGGTVTVKTRYRHRCRYLSKREAGRCTR